LDALAESVGYGNVGALQHGDTQQHYFPMYSLQKFYADVRDATPLADYTGDIVMSPKLDGAAVEHLYIDGVYARSLTDRKSTRLNSSHVSESRMPSSAWKKQSPSNQLLS